MARLLLVTLLAVVIVSASARELQADAGCTTLDVTFENLMRTGEGIKGSPYELGLQVDEKSEAVYARVDEEAKRKLLAKGAEVDVASNQPDFTSILTAPDGKIYMVTQYEAPSPSVVYMVGLDQDSKTGKLTPNSLVPVDFSADGGVWITCSGMRSPWDSHLGGEEYEPDARLLEMATSVLGDEETSLVTMDEDYANTILDYMRFFGSYSNDVAIEDVKKEFKPYQYGYMFEVAPQAGGKYEASKWYVTGRQAKELSWVMPDNKTIYHTDDGTNVGFFKTVLDAPGDKTSGCISIAKFTQTDAANGGTFDISWIEMGCATDAELKAAALNTTFSQIFAYEAPAEDGSCPDGFKSVNTGAVLEECLKLEEGAEVLAAFFESRRYGAYVGGTTEFSKWEGITYSPSRKELYTAMSEVRNGMEDNKSKGKDETKYDIGGPNEVKVEYNSCGCVYVMDVDADMSTTKMYPLVCGYANTNSSDSDNKCDLNSISNPDGMGIMEDFDTLLISEDTSAHQNDVLWTYNLNDGKMARIASTPYGAEATSGYYFPGINGFGYVVSVAQHPYVETDSDKANLANNTDFEGTEGYINYWALPESEIAGKSITFSGIPPALENKQKSTFYGSDSIEVCPKVASGPTYITPAFVPPPTEETPASPTTTSAPAPKSAAATAPMGVLATVAALVAATFMA